METKQSGAEHLMSRRMFLKTMAAGAATGLGIATIDRATAAAPAPGDEPSARMRTGPELGVDEDVTWGVLPEYDDSRFCETVEGEFSIIANDELSYRVTWNHMGLKGKAIFAYRDEIGVADHPFVTEVASVTSGEELVGLLHKHDLFRSEGMFEQIVSRFPDEATFVAFMQRMFAGPSIPIIAPDPLYIDQAIYSDGRRNDPRDYIGRMVQVIPHQGYGADGQPWTEEEAARHAFVAWVFDVKAEHHRSENYHFGDANPAFYARTGVDVDIQRRPMFVAGDGEVRVWDLPNVSYVIDATFREDSSWVAQALEKVREAA